MDTKVSKGLQVDVEGVLNGSYEGQVIAACMRFERWRKERRKNYFTKVTRQVVFSDGL